MRTVTVCLLAFGVLCPCAVSLGEQTDLQGIVAALRAAEAQFGDLRVTKSERSAVRDDKGKLLYNQEATITHRRRQRDGAEYYHVYIVSVDEKGLAQKVIRDEETSFTGKNTFWLNRIATPKGGEGGIYPGKSEELLSRLGRPDHDLWYLGVNSWAALFEKAADALRASREVVDGRTILKVSGRVGEGKYDVEVWIDPERSFLPVRQRIVAAKNGVLLMERRLHDLAELPNGVWFPQSIEAGDFGSEGGTYRIALSNAQVKELPDEDFVPDMPKGTHVTDAVVHEVYTIGELPGGDLAALTHQPTSQAALDKFVGDVQEAARSATKSSGGQRSGERGAAASGQPNGPAGPSRLLWLWVGLATVVVAGAVLWGLRKAARRTG